MLKLRPGRSCRVCSTKRRFGPATVSVGWPGDWFGVSAVRLAGLMGVLELVRASDLRVSEMSAHVVPGGVSRNRRARPPGVKLRLACQVEGFCAVCGLITVIGTRASGPRSG